MTAAESLPRVALVYDVLYPWVRGGAEKRLWEIARRLPAHGFQPHLIGPRYWDGPRSIRRDGVWLHGICPPRPLYTARGTRSVGEALAYARDLLPALLRLRVDLIDCCAFPYFPWFSARAVAARRHVPILTTWPEVWGPYWTSYLGGTLSGTVARAIEAAAARASQAHLCLSPFTARRLRDLAGARGPITPLPAGIDSRRLAGYAAPPQDREGILYVGRLLAHKRVPDLLHATGLIAQQWPEGHRIPLTIVGSGPEEPALRALATGLGLDSRVTFLSNLEEDDLDRLLGRARCLVLPSEREGQGMVIAEAQATATPPIVAAGPETAAPDFVRPGHDGLTYPAGDVPALAGALRTVLQDATVHACLSAGARQAAAALDWDTAILPRLAALYGDILNRRSDGGPPLTLPGSTSG